MGNELTRTRSGTITKSSPRRVSPQDASLVEALVKARQVQGWNLQKPEDAKLMGTIWKEQMDRHQINPKLYTKLVDMAVDHRIHEIGQGKQPTPLTVELMIACFQRYRFRKLEELASINHQLEYYRNLQHQYVTKQISLESAARQAKFHEGIGDTEFLVKSGEIISRLRDKSDRFMEENYLV